MSGLACGVKKMYRIEEITVAALNRNSWGKAKFYILTNVHKLS